VQFPFSSLIRISTFRYRFYILQHGHSVMFARLLLSR